MESLKNIQSILEKKGIKSELEAKSDKQPFDRLWVLLFEDEKERPYLLQMAYVNDILKALGVKDEKEKTFILHFYASLPYTLKEGAEASAARLLHTLTPILPLGSLSYNERDRQIYYQYKWACPSVEVDPDTLIEIVSIIMGFMVELVPVIEPVATGEKDYDTLLKDLEKMGVQLPSGVEQPEPRVKNSKS